MALDFACLLGCSRYEVGTSSKIRPLRFAGLYKVFSVLFAVCCDEQEGIICS